MSKLILRVKAVHSFYLGCVTLMCHYLKKFQPCEMLANCIKLKCRYVIEPRWAAGRLIDNTPVYLNRINSGPIRRKTNIYCNFLKEHSRRNVT